MGILKKEVDVTDERIVNNIRALGIDMIDNAKSGHPGVVLGAAPILYSLYAYHLKIDPKDDKWINRDRFVLSGGHASALLYSTLFMAGYDLSIDDLKNFRQLNSKTPGHPEYDVTPGVDVSTGPLGQGIANAVGMAISEVYLRNYFGKDLIDYNTYVLCGDGDLMEGVSYEAMSLAGHLKLNKLIVLHDSNDISLDGEVSNAFNENLLDRLESMDWNYIKVSNGEDVVAINGAIEKAKLADKPTFIEVKTTIGKYSELEGTNKVHGSPLSKEDIAKIKKKLSVRNVPFSVSDEAITNMQELISERCKEVKDAWTDILANIDDDKKEYINHLDNIHDAIKLKDLYYDFNDEKKEATRNASGKIINSIASVYSLIMGGSADLASSTKTKIDNEFFCSDKPGDRTIWFGVREHAMGSIANGMALSGITPFVSTFLSFSDYMRPAIRMSAMMNLPVVYVFSHDSISVGEDGPTHQPVEQLISLRCIPNLDVYRPADINETLGAYRNILEERRPSVVVLGRNKVDILDTTSINDIRYGAYIIEKEQKDLEGIIISTGEEIELAKKVWKNLNDKGIGIRLVSMPSMECFERQDDNYQESVLPSNIKKFVIEASSSYSWYKYTSKEYMFTVDNFGKSGKRCDVLHEYGFLEKDIELKIEELLK